MNTLAETTIEADPKVPATRMTRDFAATREQLFRAHTDPKLFALQSLVDSFEGRDAGLSSGMEVGLNEGYAKLDGMLADGTV
jgi:hypothetical protein